MSSFRAVKTIGDMSQWRISNLSLQKLLYLAHMGLLVDKSRPLVDRPFEAWDYGPVEPNVYHEFKAYGGKPIVDILFEEPYNPGDEEYEVIDSLMRVAGKWPSSRLVAVTHWKDGAWAKNYVPGVKGIIIPDEDIVDEYKRRIELGRAKAEKRDSASDGTI